MGEILGSQGMAGYMCQGSTHKARGMLAFAMGVHPIGIRSKAVGSIVGVSTPAHRAHTMGHSHAGWGTRVVPLAHLCGQDRAESGCSRF